MSPPITWSLEPAVLIGLAGAAWLYAVRWRRARAETGGRGADIARLAAFMGGLALVFAALISPLDELSQVLFFPHMMQHVLLLDLAPILLISGLTRVLLRPVTRRLVRLEQAAGPFGHPFFAIALYVGSIWLWHVPALYDAALRDPSLHVLEHITFMTAGLLYWWHLLSPIRSRRRLAGMGPTLYMASTKLVVGLLGIALTFAPGTLYDFYAHQPRYWGLAVADDQALAGLVMALEQSLVMGIALAAIFVRMLGESERETQRAERYAG
jgi:cytochrome c oxidase assembly factor CtaG